MLIRFISFIYLFRAKELITFGWSRPSLMPLTFYEVSEQPTKLLPEAPVCVIDPA